MVNGRTPGLKKLVNSVLKISIQSGSHSSVEDARFTMSLYKHVKTDWEKSFGARRGLEMKKFLEKKQHKADVSVSFKKMKQDTMDSDSDSDSDSSDE